MFPRFVRNPIYANLLMWLILGAGFLYLVTMRRETFPNFALDRILITVEARGEGPEDVEESICVKIEEAIQGIQGVRKIHATASENVGTVLAELEAGTDETDRILNEIKSRVDRLDFPDGSEKPVVTDVQVLGFVLEMSIYGASGERALKDLAEDVRKDLLALPSVSQVRIVGGRDYRIAIEVSEESLRRSQLTFDEIVQRVREQSLNLPAGGIEAESGEITIRTLGRRRTAAEFERIVLASRPDGSQVSLGQVARVSDGFDETGRATWFTADPTGEEPGLPSVQLLVYNTSEEDVLTIARDVKAYVEERRGTMPEGVEMEVWANVAGVVEDRIDLLIKNGWQGLVLVGLTLLVFQGPRLAFWVTLGVPVSMIGTFAVLHFLGHTINMPSTFAIILVIGMLVDDAIVVGENVLVHYQRGKHPWDAAVDGAREVALPVAASSATTAIAFTPILFVAGDLGKVMGVIGVVVIAALALSLFECLVILPSHLAHSLPSDRRAQAAGVWTHVQRAVDAAVARTTAVYGRLLGLALTHRGATIGLSLSLFLLALGMIRGGIVKFTVFAELDVDHVRVQFELPPGTPAARTTEVARAIEEASRRLDREHGGDLVQRVAVQVGQHTDLQGSAQLGEHLGEVTVALKPSKEGRPVTSDDFLLAWRERIGRVPQLERLDFGILELSPAGRPIEVRLIGDDARDLRLASAELQERLRSYPGILDVTDDFRLGKLEYQYQLRSHAHGFTVYDLANQLRQGFLGEEAVRIQRGREEVEAVVLYPHEERRRIADLDGLRLRSRTGDEVPIEAIAERHLVRRPDRIHRSQGDRAITVSARIDKYRANAEEVLADVERTFFPEFERRHPGLRIEFGGQRGQSEESVVSLLQGLALALFVIYLILAFTFRSYVQPLVIMSTLPLSLFGVTIGHWVMGYDLSLVSLAGFVGLAGVLVNDSIVLVEFANDALARGATLKEALLGCGQSRFRPILLTSATTFMGLVPILLEKDGQAKVMIPMAITVSFGLVLATGFVLFLVPALLSTVNDARRGWAWLWTGRLPAPEEVEPAHRRGRRQEEEELAEEDEVALPEEIAEAPMPGARVSRRIAPEVPVEPAPDRVREVFARSRDPERLLAKAAGRLERDDPEGALTYYLAALLHDRRRADVHLSIGLVRSQLGDWHGAAASFDEVLELEPDHADAREFRAWAHLRARRYELAARDFTAALGASPSNLLLLKGRATACVGMGRAEDALADLGRALVLAPQNVDLYYLRARAHQRAGAHEAAIADYDEVLRRDPTHARAHAGRGRSAYAARRLDEALASFDAAQAAAPDLDEVLLHRGRVRLAADDARGALEDLTAYLALHPDKVKVHLLLGMCRDALGDVEGAVADYRLYLEHHPRSRKRGPLERYIRQARSRTTA